MEYEFGSDREGEGSLQDGRYLRRADRRKEENLSTDEEGESCDIGEKEGVQGVFGHAFAFPRSRWLHKNCHPSCDGVRVICQKLEGH
jgi:hypothetical protein